MAEISLSAYQDRLAALLAADRHDEVIAHARHILEACPKNLRGYHQLGEALLACSRWEEAADALRRSLGAQPQRFESHWQLAQAYQGMGQGERAIWHAERAYDQQPSHAGVISMIRALYRQERDLEVDRLGMTELALARQHIRGNLLDEALTVLDGAVEREPERIDLQLTRARALWLDGQRAAAAEAADEILQQLPDSLAANRIMAELWLSEQRPSDAQRYLRRIEALDPYLAHQMATGSVPPDSLITLEELDVQPGPQDAAELSAAVPDQQIEPDMMAAGESADSHDAPSDGEIDALFDELISGGAEKDEARTMTDEFSAQAEKSDEGDSLDHDLARLLEQLDDEDDDSSWLREIQQDSLDESGDDSLEVVEDLGKEWLLPPAADEDEAGAPWLSRPASELEDDDQMPDLFADDDGLQRLLNSTSDTEPLHLEDIENWLNADDDEAGDLPDPLDDSLLDAPSWLDEDGESELDAPPLADDAQNLRNAELVESWGRELGDDDDDDDDPYVDWLSDGAPASPDEGEDAPEDPAFNAAATLSEGSPADAARAWGLKDEAELADFVDDEVALADAEASPGWLNVMVPGLDREDDAEPDNELEFARPTARPGKDFGWVSDLVEEETGEMSAVDAPPAAQDIAYFRFTQPPIWLRILRGDQDPQADALAAPIAPVPLGTDADLDELDLDDLTFDDYFNFDMPTDKMDAIDLDEEGAGIEFAELEWDDYFDFESPTEKTIAITLEDELAGMRFDELGVDDTDFALEAATEKVADITLEGETDVLEFEDIGLDDAPKRVKSDGDAASDDRDQRGDQAQLL